MDRGLLRQLLIDAFNEAELRDLCFDLRIDYEALPGRSYREKIRELIAFCERAGVLGQLITRCEEERPHHDWQAAAEAPAAETEKEKLERAIAALELQRNTLGNAVVDVALAPLRQQLEALVSPRLPPQRKQVTVLYARQSGFTMMFQTADLEALRDLVKQAWERLHAAVIAQGGLVNSRSGEQMTALFGAVHSLPDDPARAIKTALEMQASLAEMKKEQEIPLSIRIGISTGSVLLEQTGAAGEFTIIGDAVKVASLLEDQGPVNGILIADTTYDQVRGAFVVAPAEPVAMRGRAEPVPCYLVRGVKAVPVNTERHGVAGITTSMIGRDFALGQLQEGYFAAAEDSERQMVTVTGESGLGKTRLLAEFFDWLELRTERIRLFRGEALAETQGTPFGLLRDLLTQRLSGLGSAPLAQMRQELAGHLAEAFLNDPDVEMKAHFIGQLLGFDFADSPHLEAVAEDPKQLQDRATLYIIDYFVAQAGAGPVVILLENLHWADDSSLDLLNRLAQGLAGKRVFIGAATRPEFWDRRAHWGEGYEWHTRLDLRPLSRRESRRLLRELLQKMAHPPDTLQEVILDRSSGNPFYMVEIVKMLLREGTINEEGEAWVVQETQLQRLQVPTTLVGILQAHLDTLPMGEREALQRAAIVGPTFWSTTLAYLADGGSAEQLKKTDMELAQLHGREVISRREISRFQEADEYAFRNGMLRQVARESVPRRPRQVYHALVAQWLTEQQGHRADEYAGDIADHLERAGQKEKASQWLQRAGDQAAGRFAHAEAISYYSRALGMVPEDAASARVELLLKRESGYDMRGERDLQEVDLVELEALVANLADGALQARVALRRARHALAVSDYPAADRAAEQSLDLAQQVGAPDLAARAILTSGRTLWRQGENAAAKLRFEEALALARSAKQPKLEMDCLRLLGIIADEFEGDYAKARAYYEQALAIARQIGDRKGEGDALNNLGTVADAQGDIVNARAFFEQTLAIDRMVGDRAGEGLTLNNLGGIVASEGDYAGARVYIEQALEIARQIGGRMLEGYALALMGGVAVSRGDNSEAKEYCQQALVTQREIGDKYGQGYSFSFLGLAMAALGELEAAAAAFGKAFNLRQELGQQSQAIENLADLALISLAQGKMNAASDQLKKVLAWLEKHATVGMSNPLQVQLNCYRLLKAQAAQDPTLAPRADKILETAHTELLAQANRFSDVSRRLLFLENVKTHCEIIAAWESEHGGGG